MAIRNLEKKYETQKKIVSNKIQEIERLRKKISELETSAEEKGKIVESASSAYKDIEDILVSLVKRQEEYDQLISDLKKMRRVINQTVFKGRWKLIKWILR